MGAKFQKGDKIVFGHTWDKRGKVDFVLDLSNKNSEEYKYAITLNEELKETKT